MLATEKWDLKLIDSLPRVMWGGQECALQANAQLRGPGMAASPLALPSHHSQPSFCQLGDFGRSL